MKIGIGIIAAMRLSLRRILCLLVVATAIARCGFAQQSGQIPAHGKMVKLFDGKDLSGFDVLLKSKGLNHDTDHVFQVEKGVIHVSGDDFGGIVTQKEYENYYLRAEFKWGEKTYQDRVGKARDCGILYNVTGPVAVGTDVWPRSFEFQIVEGGTGDIWLVKGASLKVKGQVVSSDENADGHQYVKSPRFGEGPWVNVAGYRDPAGEVEKPHGEWNLLELVVDHDHVRYFVNGKLVNEATDLNATKGKILFQTEGAETFYRHLEIAPLKYRLLPMCS
ncbi:3-keto-disaccharide hydrolase [Acidicapsa ligni]|uniref:3-keto-disaccharide hydrolase n=1 Tax=Acidicapsa ligni TaxID=542300 RepID=UPI0021E0423B|nr:DUF1080 domain-containing protein [Acidicapsa ligni]